MVERWSGCSAVLQTPQRSLVKRPAAFQKLSAEGWPCWERAIASSSSSVAARAVFTWESGFGGALVIVLATLWARLLACGLREVEDGLRIA